MLTGYDTLVVQRPVGIFFLKQVLLEHTSEDNLVRIVREVNKSLAGHREATPIFDFKKIDDTHYQMNVSANEYGRKPNVFITSIYLAAMTPEGLALECNEANKENCAPH